MNKKVLDLLSFSNSLQGVVNGNIDLPYLDGIYDVYDTFYPHPPVLIPLFIEVDSPSIFGLRLHHFLKRNKSFVSYDLSTDYFTERARNEDQLYSILLNKMLIASSEIFDDNIRKFCESIHFKKYSEILITNEDDFHQLDFFSNELPLYFSNSSKYYNGDFPSGIIKHGDVFFKSDSISSACSFEIYDKAMLRNLSVIPEWLKDNGKRDLFSFYLSRNQFSEAWLTLNSSSWKLSDIAISLEEFMKKYDDELFHLIAQNWISGFESSFGYEDYVI